MPARGRSPFTHGRSELRQRGGLMKVVEAELQRLGGRLRALRQAQGLSQERAAELIGIHAKHLQRLEKGSANSTMATLVAVSVAYGVPLAKLFASPGGSDAPARAVRPALEPFDRLEPAAVRPFVNSIPLYSLAAAAGRFASPGEPLVEAEPEAWVAPHWRRRLRPGLFVARVVGESMNRRVPNGSFCVFRTPVPASPEGRVVLVRHRDIQDPDHQACFTVKLFSRGEPDRRAGRPRRVVLAPDTDRQGYQPMVIEEVAGEEIALIAELVQVLPG